MKHSISTPLDLACNSTAFCYTPNNALPALHALFGTQSINYNAVCPSVVTALVVIALYAMRVGELLALSTANVLPGDRVVVVGEKRSGSYLIYLPGISDQVETVSPARLPAHLFPYSYMTLYRASKKLGIGTHLEGHFNDAVTHLARYSVSALVAGAVSEAAAGDVLRHRSAGSIHYYLRKEVK